MKSTRLGFLNRISAAQKISIAVAVALAVPAFFAVRDFVACWSVTKLPGVPPASCGLDNQLQGPYILEDGESTPVAATDVPVADIPIPEATLPAWDGASRVTLLFIGVDERDWEVGAGAPRSDTMILFTIDPVSKTAGMLSIPRDLWVNIPGLGYSKINTAYAYGQARRMPGGGPGLAMKTVEHFIGVPIQYYAQVDFHAFEEAIDSIGGLYLCPGERITIDPIGPKPPVKMGPECRNYWGYEVLAYSRNRYTKGGDIDRANRQQKVIMALVEQVFSPQNFPEMAKKAPDIYLEVHSGLRTNLGFDNAMKLGYLLSQIHTENIKHGVINYSMAFLDSVTVSGGQRASILQPYPDKIRLLRDEIFLTGGPLGPASTGSPAALMQEDAARVRVVNGTNVEGLSEEVGNYLLSQGMQVIESGAQAERRYDRTTVVMYGPKLYTLRYLVSLFNIKYSGQILYRHDPVSPVDIEIRVGKDATTLIPNTP